MSDEKILAVRAWRDSALFDERERLVLELADAMTATPAQIPDGLYARLRAAFAPAQLVELTAVIAWENYRSRFNRTFEVAAEGFSEGAVCALPVKAGWSWRGRASKGRTWITASPRLASAPRRHRRR